MIAHLLQGVVIFFSLVGVSYTAIVAMSYFQGDREYKIDIHSALGATVLLGFSILIYLIHGDL